MEMSGQLHAPAALRPRETAPRTHCIGGCVGPRAGLDVMETWKISGPCRESNPDFSAVQPVAIPTAVSLCTVHRFSEKLWSSSSAPYKVEILLDSYERNLHFLNSPGVNTEYQISLKSVRQFRTWKLQSERMEKRHVPDTRSFYILCKKSKQNR
jgi:hypothetical protein